MQCVVGPVVTATATTRYLLCVQWLVHNTKALTPPTHTPRAQGVLHILLTALPQGGRVALIAATSLCHFLARIDSSALGVIAGGGVGVILACMPSAAAPGLAPGPPDPRVRDGQPGPADGDAVRLHQLLQEALLRVAMYDTAVPDGRNSWQQQARQHSSRSSSLPHRLLQTPVLSQQAVAGSSSAQQQQQQSSCPAAASPGLSTQLRRLRRLAPSAWEPGPPLPPPSTHVWASGLLSPPPQPYWQATDPEPHVLWPAAVGTTPASLSTPTQHTRYAEQRPGFHQGWPSTAARPVRQAAAAGPHEGGSSGQWHQREGGSSGQWQQLHEGGSSRSGQWLQQHEGSGQWQQQQRENIMYEGGQGRRQQSDAVAGGCLAARR